MGGFTMTNEELAVLAQNGDKAALLELWQAVEKLVYMLCYKKYYSLPLDYTAQRGVTLEDMKQEAYFAFLRAVKGYKPNKEYKFTSYINYSLKRAYTGLLGTRTKRREPLNECNSLNTPVNEEENTEFIDLLEDETTQESFNNVLEAKYSLELHKALNEAMTVQCTDKQKAVLEMRYYQNKTQKEISQLLGVSNSYIGQIERVAYRNLRGGKANKILEPFKIESLAYSFSTSFGAWKTKGSVQERALEYVDR